MKQKQWSYFGATAFFEFSSCCLLFHHNRSIHACCQMCPTPYVTIISGKIRHVWHLVTMVKTRDTSRQRATEEADRAGSAPREISKVGRFGRSIFFRHTSS